MSRPIFRGRTVKLPQGVIHKIQEPPRWWQLFQHFSWFSPWIFGENCPTIWSQKRMYVMCHSYRWLVRLGEWIIPRSCNFPLMRAGAIAGWMFVELRSSMFLLRSKIRSWWNKNLANSPVDMENLSLWYGFLLMVFMYFRWLFGISEPSRVFQNRRWRTPSFDSTWSQTNMLDQSVDISWSIEFCLVETQPFPADKNYFWPLCNFAKKNTAISKDAIKTWGPYGIS